MSVSILQRHHFLLKGTEKPSTKESGTPVINAKIPLRCSAISRDRNATHDGVRYPCDQCEYISTQPSNLKLHKESKLQGIRYSCGECEYKAMSACNLTIHKKSKHEGIRYPCDECEYAAAQSSHLRLHKQTMHEGI